MYSFESAVNAAYVRPRWTLAQVYPLVRCRILPPALDRDTSLEIAELSRDVQVLPRSNRYLRQDDLLRSQTRDMTFRSKVVDNGRILTMGNVSPTLITHGVETRVLRSSGR
jgi:hypothetical protein